ncbi:hypothetical protein BDF21DRAFT_452339 [Thamnidium elegans]|nr:hypothetical protein BDF21DRAFT_452339 [Thamnidium elegans]
MKSFKQLLHVTVLQMRGSAHVKKGSQMFITIHRKISPVISSRPMSILLTRTELSTIYIACFKVLIFGILYKHSYQMIAYDRYVAVVFCLSYRLVGTNIFKTLKYCVRWTSGLDTDASKESYFNRHTKHSFFC